MEILRDSIWQGIGVFSGLFIAIIIFILQRKIKSLGYEVLASTSLISLDEEIKGKVKILYNDTSVKQVHLLILEILNDGNVPITTSDFETPLIFDFGENTRILSVEIIKTEPANLKPEILGTSENNISLKPLLLNSKDSIQLKFLLAQFEGIKEVNARINGVKEVKKGYRRKRQAWFSNLFWLIVLTTFIMLIIRTTPIIVSTESDGNGTFLNFSSGFIFSLFIVGIIGTIFNRIGIASSKIKKPDSPELHRTSQNKRER